MSVGFGDHWSGNGAQGRFVLAGFGIGAVAGLHYRIPIALHNVSRLMLNMASQQVAAAVSNCPRIECAAGADRIPWAITNPIVIKSGYMEVSNEPGLGCGVKSGILKSK